MKLLLVEDDFDLIRSLTRALGGRGFEVVGCGDGLEALALCKRQRFDAIVLDLTIPGIDGLHVLQRMRRGDDLTPVLVLTARGAVGDRVIGLNAGADDYLAKPFDLDELEARVRALIRRAIGEGGMRVGLLRHDRATGAFYRDEQPFAVAPKEGVLLQTLMAAAGRALSREQLHLALFPDEHGAQLDAIEVVVHRLRRRLEGACVEIVTLRGVGYLLREDRESLVRGHRA